MQVTVTGAAGFVGSHLVAALAAAGHSVRAVTRRPQEFANERVTNLAAGDLLEHPLDELAADADAVINLAARVHVTRETSMDPSARYWAMNCDFPVRLGKAAHAAGAVRFVQLSSVAALARITPPGEICDDSAAERPDTPYGKSKNEADHALMQLASTTGLSVVCLRAPAVYGPGARALFPPLLRCARAGLPLPLGGIENARSFIYVDNLISALIRALHAAERGIFIVTDSAPVSTGELYRQMVRAKGKRPFTPAIPGTVLSLLARPLLGQRADSIFASSAFDGSRFARLFEWQPPFTFPEGVSRMVKSGDL